MSFERFDCRPERSGGHGATTGTSDGDVGCFAALRMTAPSGGRRDAREPRDDEAETAERKRFRPKVATTQIAGAPHETHEVRAQMQRGQRFRPTLMRVIFPGLL